MNRVLRLACGVGLLVSFVDVDYAAAQCVFRARPDFMTGSPPKGQRSPIAILADRTDAAHCEQVSNNCAAPTPHATVVETAPSCTCVCQ
jgi:hypothetical protein